VGGVFPPHQERGLSGLCLFFQKLSFFSWKWRVILALFWVTESATWSARGGLYGYTSGRGMLCFPMRLYRYIWEVVHGWLVCLLLDKLCTTWRTNVQSSAIGHHLVRLQLHRSCAFVRCHIFLSRSLSHGAIQSYLFRFRRSLALIIRDVYTDARWLRYSL